MTEFDYKGALVNLLARIHRDGGQYTNSWGLEKSCQDADLIISELLPAHPHNPKLAADRQIVAWIVYREGEPPLLTWSKPSARGVHCQPLEISKVYKV